MNKCFCKNKENILQKIICFKIVFIPRGSIEISAVLLIAHKWYVDVEF